MKILTSTDEANAEIQFCLVNILKLKQHSICLASTRSGVLFPVPPQPTAKKLKLKQRKLIHLLLLTFSFDFMLFLFNHIREALNPYVNNMKVIIA